MCEPTHYEQHIEVEQTVTILDRFTYYLRFYSKKKHLKTLIQIIFILCTGLCYHISHCRNRNLEI